MQEPTSADQELINRIRQGDRQALELVYKANRTLIRRYVLQNQGTAQDAQDMYQEVILAFYQNVMTGKLAQLSGKLSTYLFKIAQNQWRNRLRDQQRMATADSIDDTLLAQDEGNTVREDAYLNHLISRLGDRCRQILLSFYFDRLSMEAVARQVGLADGESARKRKYDCLDQLKKLAHRYKETDYDPDQPTQR